MVGEARFVSKWDDGPEARNREADGRIDARTATALPATLRGSDKQPRDAVVRDISTTGFSVTLRGAELSPGEHVTVGIPGARTKRASVVWADADRAGFRFADAWIKDPSVHLGVNTVASMKILRPPPYDVRPLLEGEGDLASAPMTDAKLPWVWRGPVLVASVILPWSAIGGFFYAFIR